MFKEIDVIKDLAFKYSKEQLGRMAQMGMIEPQKAMMAGMMRDRVAKEDTKPPTSTVAQDVLGMQPPQQPQPPQLGMQQPQGAMQPQQPQMGMPPQPEQPPMGPTQMAATGGLTSLSIPEQDYAGGGIVAFDEGGEVPGYAYGGIPQAPSMDIQLGQFKGPQEKTIEEILAEQQGVYEKQGLVNPYTGMIEQQEAKRGEFGKRREQAQGEFLMNLGTGLMQAQKGRELAALGAGATKGMADYKDAMKDLRASEEKLDDRIGAFKLADYQAKKTGTDAAIARRDSLLDKVRDTENKNIEAKNAVAVEGKKLETQMYGKQVDYASAENAQRISGSNQIALEKLRQQALPDIMKVADSKQMKEAMPNATFFQRVEAYALATHPKDVQNAVINAVTAANKAADAEWSQKMLFSKPLQDLQAKASNGDKAAADKLKKERDVIDNYHLNKVYRGEDASRQGSTIIAPPPAAVDQLKANDNPQTRAYFDQVFGQGSAAKVLGQ
jgi:hypothetical protein